MKTLIATLLATAAGASFAAAPTVALTHDPATYRNVTQKPEADYKVAVAKCDAINGNDKNVCMADAKLARTRAEADILSRYNTTPASRERARTNMADAEFAVAKAKCDGKTGADKDDCVNSAKSVHTAALADAKTDRTGAAAGTAAAGSAVVVSNADVPAGQTGLGTTSTAASKTRDAAATAADKTKAVAATAAEKTKEVAETAVEKTKQAASTIAQKTERAFDRAGDARPVASTTTTTTQKTDDAFERAGDKTASAGAKARVAASDTTITAKVKAGLIKEAKLDALGIHVETEKGTVMLSGFVNSKADADKALQVAKGVDGVGNVRSALQVK